MQNKCNLSHRSAFIWILSLLSGGWQNETWKIQSTGSLLTSRETRASASFLLSTWPCFLCYSKRDGCKVRKWWNYSQSLPASGFSYRYGGCNSADDGEQTRCVGDAMALWKWDAVQGVGYNFQTIGGLPTA